MRIQKCYIGYCIATWSLWGIALILGLLSGPAYNIRCEALWPVAYEFTRICVIISWIPVHPVLFIWALISSLRHHREGHTSFNIFSMMLTTILALAVFISYVAVSGV